MLLEFFELFELFWGRLALFGRGRVLSGVVLGVFLVWVPLRLVLLRGVL